MLMQLYVGSVQYVSSLLFASLCYFLITGLVFYNIFCMYVLCFVFFSVLYVLCFCIFLYCFVYCFSFCAVSFLFLYKSTDHCHRVETQLL